MKPSWIPQPLDPAHAKRLEAWARTLPGTIHKPWRSENPAEEKIRLANEARLRTRRLRKLGGEKGRRVTQARISDELLLTREKPHERKVRLKTEWQRRRRAELRVSD